MIHPVCDQDLTSPDEPLHESVHIRLKLGRLPREDRSDLEDG